MRDLRGIDRGYCSECGKDECPEFVQGAETKYACEYCAHPPVMHIKSPVGPVDFVNIQSDVINIMEEVETKHTPIKTDTIVTDLAIDAGECSQNLTTCFAEDNQDTSRNCYISQLPNVSHCVETALTQKSLTELLWSNFIMQAAAYYINIEGLCTKSAYDLVGRLMYDKYPAIEKIGTKPWVFYLRCNIKSENLPQDKNIELRKKVDTEWNKKLKDKVLIKSFLRDSFEDRSNLLIEKGNFIEEYPCFTDAEYGDVLESWINFEKATGIFTSGEKTEHIIKVVTDRIEYREMMALNADVPMGLAYVENGKIIDVVAKYKQHIIFVPKPDILYFITLLLSMYYVLELNYPKRFLQAMGAIGSFALDDNYYKLGSKATRKISSLLVSE